jgi:abortive infection bacteriophage resistance protein
MHKGSFAHYNTAYFRTGFEHAQWIKELEDETTRSHEVFVIHYRTRYNEYPRLPLWMATEIMSMGKLSQFYSGLLPDYQRLVSKPLGIHHSVLRSWLHTLTYLRNLCAHHARIWNRELAIRPEMPRKDPAWRLIDNTRIYAATVMMEWLMRKAALPVEPVLAVYKSMDNLRIAEPVLAKGMGGPAGWQGECRWESAR